MYRLGSWHSASLMGDCDRLVLKTVIAVRCKNPTAHINAGTVCCPGTGILNVKCVAHALTRYPLRVLRGSPLGFHRKLQTVSPPKILFTLQGQYEPHGQVMYPWKNKKLTTLQWAVFKWNLSHGSGAYSHIHSHHRRKFSPPPLHFPYSCYLELNPLSKLIDVLYFNHTGFQVYRHPS